MNKSKIKRALLIVTIIVTVIGIGFLYLYQNGKGEEQESLEDFLDRMIAEGAITEEQALDLLGGTGKPIPPPPMTIDEQWDMLIEEQGLLPPTEIERLFSQTQYGSPPEPLEANVQDFITARPGQNETVIAAGEGGVYSIYKTGTGAVWQATPLGPDDFIVNGGMLPDGSIWVAGEFALYLMPPGADGTWDIIYQPGDANGGGGATFDAMYYDDQFYLATTDGVVHGTSSPDNNWDWELLAPDIFAWSIIRVGEKFYLGGEMETSTSFIAAGTEQITQVETVGVVWQMDVSGHTQVLQTFPNTPTIREVVYADIPGIGSGVVARGHDALHFEALG
ncbi:MAG: hypothetical protein D6706_17165 [Chloroflexi bacterium]|nr:MAG: hypothetical protein D6706_17165 [Chloroflexota bacterium]